MIAAKAILEAGVELPGDLIVTGVCGEIGQEPVDEFSAPQYLSKEVGTRYLVSHGVIGDYAVVAEATDFGVTWVEAGKAFFKVTVLGGNSRYTPYVDHPNDATGNGNALVRVAPVIECIERWARRYESEHVYHFDGGVCVPKVNIGAIRGGQPFIPIVSAERCYLYLDVRLTPAQTAMEVQAELRDVLAEAGVPTHVECTLYRRGYEATGVEPLLEVTERAHRAELGRGFGEISAPLTSMWRDTNPFVEVGIPAITYGPAAGVGGGLFWAEIDDFVSATRIYARLALELVRSTQGRQVAMTIAVTHLRRVAVTTPDPAGLATFYETVWGLQRVATQSGVAYLRGTGDEHHILAIHAGEQATMFRYTLGLGSALEVDAAADELAGNPSVHLVRPPAPIAEPGGGYGFAIADPDGREIEMAADVATAATPEYSATVLPRKLSHVVLNSPNVDAYAGFLIDVLGFRLADEAAHMLFLKCNRDHHTVALARAPHASLNHIAFEVPSVDDVRHGIEHLRAQGYETIWGPGRHGPGQERVRLLRHSERPGRRVHRRRRTDRRRGRRPAVLGAGGLRDLRRLGRHQLVAADRRGTRDHARCSGALSPHRRRNDSDSGGRDVTRLNEQLVISGCGADATIVCRCGQPLGPAGENYKLRALMREGPVQNAGPWVDPNRIGGDRFVCREFFCPGVRDPARRGDRPARRADPLGRTRRCPAVRSSDVTIDVPTAIRTRWSSDDPNDEFVVDNPATGRTIAVVGGSGAAEIDAAVRAAHDGHQTWKRRAPRERGKVLLRAAALIREHADELAELECAEMGKPVSQARNVDVEQCITLFEYYAGLVEVLPSQVREQGYALDVTMLEPYGVVAGIIPFNWPPLHIAGKGAPGLAVGNGVVLEAARTGAADDPANRRPRAIGAPRRRPPHRPRRTGRRCRPRRPPARPQGRVHRIDGGGTGGRPHGRREPDSNSPGARRQEPADRVRGRRPRARRSSARSKVGSSTRVRRAPRHRGLLVHRAVHDRFVARLVAAVERLRVGDGSHAGTHVGPMITSAHQQRVLDYIALGVAEGAEIVAQAPLPDTPELADGYFVPPTVFAGVTPQMRVAKEEIFGPVVCVIAFDDEEDAVRIANDTEFGLIAGVYTRDAERADARQPTHRRRHGFRQQLQSSLRRDPIRRHARERVRTRPRARDAPRVRLEQEHPPAVRHWRRCRRGPP